MKKINFKELTNSRATFEYEILDQIEAGMILSADVVKTIATNKFSLTGNYVKIVGEEIFLIGDSVDHSIKLLLNKSEINKLIGKVQISGLTIIPLKIYRLRGKFKVLIALAKGKREYDKRAANKSRDIDLENRRIIKSQKFE